MRRSYSFQTLEKSLKKFPTIGKYFRKTSKHWKKLAENFQTLEKYSVKLPNIGKLFQSLKIFIFCCGLSVGAAEVRVAVASNFYQAALELSQLFEAATEHKIILIPGSTAKLYAQIRNGAPFDVFFAADTKHPQLLAQENLTVDSNGFVYASGHLWLWSSNENYVDSEGKILANGDFKHLAIANPKLAPYGIAAREVLQSLGQWQKLKSHIVHGENAAQTYHFVFSGNVELGFVPSSLVVQMTEQEKGSWWVVPQALYSPIEQRAVLLRDLAAAREFLVFVRSEAALEIIRDYGYGTP